ncbi:hypothetical protein DFJ73DRAFT_780405 [Zopfochytrium polystomum]|nr:hypothetical protein DFJ73DRAFT_780405 [Zopfochytrium polystomum]
MKPVALITAVAVATVALASSPAYYVSANPNYPGQCTVLQNVYNTCVDNTLTDTSGNVADTAEAYCAAKIDDKVSYYDCLCRTFGTLVTCLTNSCPSDATNIQARKQSQASNCSTYSAYLSSSLHPSTSASTSGAATTSTSAPTTNSVSFISTGGATLGLPDASSAGGATLGLPGASTIATTGGPTLPGPFSTTATNGDLSLPGPFSSGAGRNGVAGVCISAAGVAAAAREDERRNLRDDLNAEVFATVQAGAQLGELFQSCWAVDHTTRPSFPEIATKTVGFSGRRQRQRAGPKLDYSAPRQVFLRLRIDGAGDSYASDATVVVDFASMNIFPNMDLQKTKSDSSDSHGQYNLALRYHFGIGTAKDVAKAAQWIKLAAENTLDSRNLAACHFARLHIAVMVSVGEGFPAGGDLPEGLNLEEMDATGDMFAQFAAARFYTFGYGTTQNADEMIKRLLRSAWQGLPDAQFRLGEAYYEGSGVPQNRTEAVNWFRKAAKHGDADGQVCLGKAYYEGNGVPQDHSEAVKWFRKAAEQVDWFRKAAEPGSVDGQFWLGRALYAGNGLKIIPRQSAKQQSKGMQVVNSGSATPAEQGHLNGQYMLEKAYNEGSGVPQNHSETVNWFRKAAEQGNLNGRSGVRTTRG